MFHDSDPRRKNIDPSAVTRLYKEPFKSLISEDYKNFIITVGCIGDNARSQLLICSFRSLLEISDSSVAAILYCNGDMGLKIFDSDNARDYLYCRNRPWVLLEVLERGDHISGLHPTTCETKLNQSVIVAIYSVCYCQ